MMVGLLVELTLTLLALMSAVRSEQIKNGIDL
ncbi:MAG: hypothetical protein ACJASU_001344 [Cognaticolwellia sp.]|jgi:hypothetical protein